jgi:hypothetical protein
MNSNIWMMMMMMIRFGARGRFSSIVKNYFAMLFTYQLDIIWRHCNKIFSNYAQKKIWRLKDMAKSYHFLDYMEILATQRHGKKLLSLLRDYIEILNN